MTVSCMHQSCFLVKKGVLCKKDNFFESVGMPHFLLGSQRQSRTDLTQTKNVTGTATMGRMDKSQLVSNLPDSLVAVLVL